MADDIYVTMDELDEEDPLKDYHDMFVPDNSIYRYNAENTVNLKLTDIRPFPDHPFRVVDDESMETLTESIKEHGLILPVFVRPLKEGGYEMISGHRRKMACEKAGMTEIPSVVLDISRDEAIILLVDTNLQRDEILPSEKAFAYKLKMEALRRQGKRTDLTSRPVGEKLEGLSVDKVADSSEDSARQIHRYIRLTKLVPELRDRVDKGEMGMRPAVELSYLSPEEQKSVVSYCVKNQNTPNHEQTIRMRKKHNAGILTDDSIEEIMSELKGNQKERLLIKDPDLIERIPGDSPAAQLDFIRKAVDFYCQYLDQLRKREEGLLRDSHRKIIDDDLSR